MGQVVLLVVAAAWAAVLIPPLVRSRIENRPNSSVTDFRNQLSSLQKMPSRSVVVRSMARPLTSSSSPSWLSRPAAPGRPVMRSGVGKVNGSVARPTGTVPPRPDAAAVIEDPPTARPRRHAGGRPDHRRQVTVPRQQASAPAGAQRRRANVIFVLGLVSGSSLFLAATTNTDVLYYVFGGFFAVLCVYVYVIGQQRQRRLAAAQASPPRPVRPARAPRDGRLPERRPTARRGAATAPSHQRSTTAQLSRRRQDHWSHAV